MARLPHPKARAGWAATLRPTADSGRGLGSGGCCIFQAPGNCNLGWRLVGLQKHQREEEEEEEND